MENKKILSAPERGDVRLQTEEKKKAPDITMRMENVSGFLSTVPDASDTNESSGLEMGNVSENLSEAKSRKGDSASGGSTQQDDSTVPAPLPVLRIPKPQIMVRKIKTIIGDEVKNLEKKIKHYEKDPIGNAYQLSESVSLLRKLRSLLKKLIYASLDYIKDVWVHIMQGKKLAELLK